MLRRITTFVVLGALAGIYAIPLAAAIFPLGISDCCAHGMCPRMKQAAKTETEDDAMPDCAMNDQKSGAPVACKCVASPCEARTGNTISIGYYVLPAPTRVVFAEPVSPFVGVSLQFARNITAIPDAPPPRS
jgi:hypothetical protein